MSDQISVVEVITAAGWPYSKKLAWTVGREVSREWRKEFDRAPDYAMKPKTSKSASSAPAHMKAVYPEEWRKRIEDVARRVMKKEDPTATPQKPLGASPRGEATAYAAWALEALTGHQQALTWRVDLRRDVGTPDAIGDEDGYHDQRWTQAISRLKQALEDHQGHPQARTQLILLIDCMVGVEQGVPHPVRVDLSTPQDVIVALLSSYPPPYGKWQLRSSEVLHSEYRVSTPETYFIDGIPF